LLTTALLVALVSAGAVIILQGFLIVKGRRRPRMAFFERPLVEAHGSADAARVAIILGRLRMVYGLFLVLVGIWGLSGAL
jgi:hypothetical protein